MLDYDENSYHMRVLWKFKLFFGAPYNKCVLFLFLFVDWIQQRLQFIQFFFHLTVCLRIFFVKKMFFRNCSLRVYLIKFQDLQQIEAEKKSWFFEFVSN